MQAQFRLMSRRVSFTSEPKIPISNIRVGACVWIISYVRVLLMLFRLPVEHIVRRTLHDLSCSLFKSACI